MKIKCVEFKPYWNGDVAGFMTILFEDLGFTLCRFVVYQKESGDTWVQLPQRRDSETILRKKSEGKKQLVFNLMHFEEKEQSDLFQLFALKAWAEWMREHPDHKKEPWIAEHGIQSLPWAHALRKHKQMRRVQNHKFTKNTKPYKKANSSYADRNPPSSSFKDFTPSSTWSRRKKY